MTDVPSNYSTDARFEGVLDLGNLSFGSYSGVLETLRDEDWIQVSLSAGVSYSFTASIDGDKQLDHSPTLRLYYGSGGLEASGDINFIMYDSVCTISPTSSGVYYLSVATDGGPPAAYGVSLSTIAGQTNWRLSELSNTYTGGAGQRILAGPGDDVITMGLAVEGYGGIGNDTFSTENNAYVFGGHGDDLLTMTAGNIGYFFGEEGNDRLIGNTAADHFYGGAGNSKRR